MHSTPQELDAPGVDPSAAISPQRRRGLCKPPTLELTTVDRIPLLALSSEEKTMLQRHAEQLSAQLLGLDGTVVLRQLLAKRLALLDIECQRMSAVQEICLRGTTTESIRKAREVNRPVNSAHRRFVATAELFHRPSAPTVSVAIRHADQVAVVDARRTT